MLFADNDDAGVGFACNVLQSTFHTWFIVLADADCNPVPTVHITNVDRLKAPGAIAYPAIDVRTTSPASK